MAKFERGDYIYKNDIAYSDLVTNVSFNNSYNDMYSIRICDKTIFKSSLSEEERFISSFLKNASVSPKGALKFVKNEANLENYISTLETVSTLFYNNKGYKHLLSKPFRPSDSLLKKHSIILVNNKQKNILVHIYIKNEPDFYSDYKVVKIECERISYAK